MQNLDNPVILREKSAAAYCAGDYEKSALYDALADTLEQLEVSTNELSDTKKELENQSDYAEYKQFFRDCFERLAGHYPHPEVTSDYDCSIIFDAIEKGES